MAGVTITLKNGPRVLAAFRAAPDVMARELQAAIVKVGGFTAGKAKEIITSGVGMWKAPVDTGAMRRGISLRQVGKLRVTITPSAITPYALYVHEGTRKMRARPFFKITAKRSQKDIEGFFNRALENAVKRIANASL